MSTERPAHGATRWLVLVGFATSGLASLGFEVIWTRQLVLFMGTSIYAFTAMLVLFLTGLGLGSLLGGQTRDRAGQTVLLFGLLQCLLGALGLVGQCWIGMLPAGNPYETRALVSSLGAAFLVVFPFALVSGMMFPRAVRAFARTPGKSGESLGVLYAANTLGCIVGSLGTGFVLIPAFGSSRAAVALASLNVAAGLVLWAFGSRPAPKRISWLAMPAFALITVALIPSAGRAYDTALMRSATYFMGSNAEVYFHREGAVAATTAIGDKSNPRGGRLWVNGVGMTCLGTMTKLMAHLPLMLHGHAEHVLVICFGMGTTVRSAAAYPNVSVTSVELVPEVYQCFGYFHADGPTLWHRPDVHAIVDDGRNYLLMHDDTYDLITIDPPPPVHSAGTANLYSREFFELCRRRLRPTGTVCLWIPAVAKSELMVIMASFGSVFSHTTLWSPPDDTGFYLIGQLVPRELEPATVQVFLAVPEIQRDLGEYGFRCDGAEDLERLRLLDEQEFRTLVGPYPVMTDNRPYTEFPLWRSLLQPRTWHAYSSDDLKREWAAIQQPTQAPRADATY